MSTGNILDHLLELGLSGAALPQVGDASLRQFLVTDPDMVLHVLARHADRYGRNTKAHAVSRAVLGDGLLVSDGANWIHQRRLLQPFFSYTDGQQQLDHIFRAVRQFVEQEEEGWTSADSINLCGVLRSLSLSVLLRTVFSIDRSDHERRAAAIWHELSREIGRRLAETTAIERNVSESHVELDELLGELKILVQDIISSAQSEAGAGGVLGSLIQVEQQGLLGENDIAQIITNLLLAGHESTSASLSWSLALLHTHPNALEKLQREVGDAFTPAGLELAEFNRMTYLDAVASETLRLYPPGWAIFRTARVDDELSGHKVHEGDTLIMSPYVMHRLPKLWADPDSFDPRRFCEPGAAPRHPGAYFPFGLGPHTCLGLRFAMLELKTVLGYLIQRFSFTLLPGQDLTIEPLVALRPKRELTAVVRRRKSNG
jgi:cytochrome P450